jgi:hypothetical protein
MKGRWPFMRRIRAATFTSLAVVLVLVGCASSKSRALDRATEQVRKQATDAYAGFTAIIGDRFGGDVNKVFTAARDSISLTQYNGVVFASSVQPGDRIRLDIAFVAQSNAGGGMDYETATVRLCARFEGTPRDQSTLSDVDCSPDLPTSLPYFGNITDVVKLDD